MQVIEYLKQNGVEKLKEEFAIIVKEVDELLVLNYNQIESPKAHPIVMECRSLILDKEFKIVSRSFDRFFNFGEAPDTQTHLDFPKAVCFEKVDGSLIKIYNHNGVWQAATRGTAYAESECNFGPTFKSLVMNALELEQEVEFQGLCDLWLDREWTYIFEITSVENRVVKRYEGYTLHYLSARHNKTGEFGDEYEKKAGLMIGAKEIKQFNFDSVEHCVKAAKELPDLEEGYVVYQDGVPVCKIKSPAYLAVHAIRGEGLTPKRIMQLVLMNEQSEYLSYFPEDTDFFTPYITGLENLLQAVDITYDRFEGIAEQKQFALSVKDYPFSAVMFQARQKKQSATHTFHEQTESYKMKVLEQFV